MRKILLALLFAIAPFSFAQAADLPVTNAGFVPANIWYSKDPFFTGDSVRIYTIIFNGSTYDLTGDVQFLDNGIVIGTTNFSLSGNGRVQDVWIDWKATSGAHTITAQLINVIANGPKGKQTVSLDNSVTGKSERTVAVDPAVVAAQTQAQVQKVTDAGVQAVTTVQGAVNSVTDAIPAPVKETVSSGAHTIESFRIGEASQFQTARAAKAKEIDVMNAKELATSTPLQLAAQKSLPGTGQAPLTVSKNGVIKNATSSKSSVAPVTSSPNAMEKPFAYVMLAVLTLLQYFFEWPILFYGIILYVVYRILKWGINKIRNRE